MSDEVNNGAATNEKVALSPAQVKALEQQRTWKKFFTIFNIAYLIGTVILFGYVWFFMM